MVVDDTIARGYIHRYHAESSYASAHALNSDPMGIFFRESKKLGRNGRVNVSSGGVGGSYKLGPARITQKANGQQMIRIQTGIPGLNFTKIFGKKRR